jgi:hypothetical protein
MAHLPNGYEGNAPQRQAENQSPIVAIRDKELRHQMKIRRKVRLEKFLQKLRLKKVNI